MAVNNVTEKRSSLEGALIAFDKATNRKVQLTAKLSAQILAPNSNRAGSVIVVASDASVTLHFGDGNAVLEHGILLTGKGSSYEITALNLFSGRVAAISLTNTELSVVEFTF